MLYRPFFGYLMFWWMDRFDALKSHRESPEFHVGVVAVLVLDFNIVVSVPVRVNLPVDDRTGHPVFPHILVYTAP